MAREGVVRLLVLLTAWVLIGPSCLGLPARALSTEPIERVVVRLYVRDRDHLNAVAGELDIWEVHYEAGFAVVAVTPVQYRWLESLGYQVEIDREQARTLGVQAPMDPRYYYFDEDYANQNGRYVVSFLQEVNTAYPALTELWDVGDAWEAGQEGKHDRDIWVLRITNEAPAYGEIAAKPAFVLLAAIHAREVVGSELVIRYIQYLTGGFGGEGGYGLDPDVTWLVDHHVAYVLVMLNPDGHRVNESNTVLAQRKNMNDLDGCSSPGQWGVDLNRNHSYFWGGGGSSSNACADTYRGSSAASEPETVAFQEFFAGVMLDQNGPNGDFEIPPSAPQETSGIFLSLHSYSDLVLWPWAFSYAAAPNGSQLQTIGRKLAYYNGYVPQQASQLYQASGITSDWTYGKFGVASFTFEVGTGYPSPSTPCEGFFPAFECIDTPGPDGTGNFWPENRPAFLYAHKIARAPYMLARGPDAVDVSTTPLQIPQGAAVHVTVTIDDTRFNNSRGEEPIQTIAAAEYYVDVPPWASPQTSSAHALAPADGAFDESVEEVEAYVDTSDLSLGQHTLFVRGQDADGNWGAFTAAFVTITPGVDPGGITLALSPSSIPIVQGRATATATLTYPGGAPAPGWIVAFATSLGAMDPSMTYSDVDGQAVVTLHAPDVTGTAQVIATQSSLSSAPATIQFYVPDPPTAAFASNSPMCLGAVATFTNTSSSPPLAPASFFWEFGDGATSARPSPQHQYGTPGLFAVRLTAANAGGQNSHSDTIEVKDLPQAAFGFTPLSPRPGEPLQFMDRSLGDPIAWDWDFGDGGVASIQSPTYMLSVTGTYTVTLQVRNMCGWSDPVQQAITVGGDGPRYRRYLPLFFRMEPVQGP